MNAQTSQKHLIITGGAGFIGSHLSETLLAKGYAVTAIDNLVTGAERNIEHLRSHPDFDFVLHDVSEPIGDLEARARLVKKLGVAGVFHFACPASPIDFERIPLEILAVDSFGTRYTVEWAQTYKARYLLASTSEIYGDPLVHPQTEDYWGNVSTLGPRACYDEAKRFAEAYVSSARRTYKLNAGIVRIFNTYGPRMRPDDGRIVPELCMQALSGKPLTVHGDGKQTRSFCYVTDLVDGIIKLFESTEFGPVNLGNPVERTVLDFAEVLIRLTGSRSKLEHLEARPDDPRRRCPDISRARSLLHWEPKITLDEGLARTVDYFRAFS